MNPTKKKKVKPNGRIPYDPMILCDLTRFYIRSYYFCDPATILNFLVRWDRKIVQFYNLDCDFDNHACNYYLKKKKNLLFMVEDFLKFKLFCY